MPIEYWVLRDANITYARWYDHIDTAEMRRNFEAYLKDPNYKAGRPELIDLREVSFSDVDIGGVSMLLNKANSQDFGQGPGTLTSILVTDESGYGHSRQYQSLADMRGGIQVHISDSEEDALGVLGRSEADLQGFLNAQPDYKR